MWNVPYTSSSNIKYTGLVIGIRDWSCTWYLLPVVYNRVFLVLDTLMQLPLNWSEMPWGDMGTFWVAGGNGQLLGNQFPNSSNHRYLFLKSICPHAPWAASPFSYFIEGRVNIILMCTNFWSSKQEEIVTCWCWMLRKRIALGTGDIFLQLRYVQVFCFYFIFILGG